MDELGTSVSVYGDTIAVSAVNEDSFETSITNGPGASVDDSEWSSGAVYIYRNKSVLSDPLDLYASRTNTSITLSWVDPGGSSSNFVVTYQSGSVAPANCTFGTKVSVRNEFNHTVSSLDSGATYSFRVCATDGTNLSSGGVITVTTY